MLEIQLKYETIALGLHELVACSHYSLHAGYHLQLEGTHRVQTTPRNMFQFAVLNWYTIFKPGSSLKSSAL